MKWIIAVLALAGCNGCGAYIAPIITMPLHPGIYGATRCSDNNLPVILVSPGLSPEQKEEVLVHEKVHVRQMVSHVGGCKQAFMHALGNKRFRVSQEREAYCAGLRHMQKKQGWNNREINEFVGKVFRISYDTLGITCSSPPIWTPNMISHIPP